MFSLIIVGFFEEPVFPDRKNFGVPFAGFIIAVLDGDGPDNFEFLPLFWLFVAVGGIESVKEAVISVHSIAVVEKQRQFGVIHFITAFTLSLIVELLFC
jgi:hypothetical protein